MIKGSAPLPVVVATLLSVACASGQVAPATTGGAPIVIGAVLPLTGYGAVFGASALNGMRLAVDEANAAGGALGRPLELRARDDKGDATEGATAYRASIEIDGAIAIAGAVMSKISLAGAPICQARGVPMVSPTSTNPRVTEVGDYIFRTAFIDPFQGTMAATFALGTLGARTAACVFARGNDYAEGVAETFRAAFTEGGGAIAAFESHEMGAYDFEDILVPIIETAPDLIFIADYYNDAASVAAQARELGYRGRFVGIDGWDSPELVRMAGNALEGSFFINHWHTEAASPESLRFADAYRFRYGENPDLIDVCGYESARVIIEGLRSAGTVSGPALRDAIAATELVLPTGRFAFDAARNPVKSAAVIIIRNGRFEWFATVDPPRK